MATACGGGVIGTWRGEGKRIIQTAVAFVAVTKLTNGDTHTHFEEGQHHLLVSVCVHVQRRLPEVLPTRLHRRSLHSTLPPKNQRDLCVAQRVDEHDGGLGGAGLRWQAAPVIKGEQAF